MATYYYLVNDTTKEYHDLGKLCLCRSESHNYFTRVDLLHLLEYFANPNWVLHNDARSDLDFFDTHTCLNEDAV